MIHFDQLWPKYNIHPMGVLHLGANTGQEAEVYNRHMVTNVIWVEAIPGIFEKLSEHISAYTNQTAVLACVGDEEGKEVDFKISNNEAQSSSYLELKHHKIIHPEVSYIDSFKTKMRRIDKMFHPDSFKFGSWFLNADLQGAELQAFKGMGNMISDFKWIYTEVNKQETYEGCALIDELDAYLKRFGFDRVETGGWVGDTWTDALYVKQ
jgi:FkbM family methyltransferase